MTALFGVVDALKPVRFLIGLLLLQLAHKLRLTVEKSMSKTLFDFIQKEPEPTVYCHEWKQDVPLKRCLERCGTAHCLDIDQIVQLRRRLAKA
jgi:hypothetical protein